MKKESELILITKSKMLTDYIFEITESSPKRFRFTLVSRMQNLALDILGDIYNANDTFVDMKIVADMNKSIEHAKRVINEKNDEKLFFKNKLFELKLARANKIEEKVSTRMDYSYKAMTNIKLLDYIIGLAAYRGCITKAQREKLAEQLFDVRNLLGAFIKSDKKRYNC